MRFVLSGLIARIAFYLMNSVGFQHFEPDARSLHFVNQTFMVRLFHHQAGRQRKCGTIWLKRFQNAAREKSS